jgi:hypothetical protein
MTKKSDDTIRRKTGTGTSYSSSNDLSQGTSNIDIGADGSVYAITTTSVSKKGYTMKKYNAGDTWSEISNTPLFVKDIAVGNIGYIWVVNLNGEVFSHVGRSDWI